MPGKQVRLDEAVVDQVHRNRVLLGFPADAPDGVVVSELTREAMEARLEAHRRQERARLYTDWAQERDLREGTGDALRAAVEDGIA